MTRTRDQLAGLLREAGAAHHRAFAATNGDDPDWAHWYAQYLVPRLQGLLERERDVDGLALRLTRLDEEHRVAAPDEAWPEYYARRLLERGAR